MLTIASYLAVVLYIVPVLVLFTVRARSDAEVWQFALDVPLGIALDLLSVLSLTLFVRLELATIASRVLWLTGVFVWLAWRRRRGLRLPRWPRVLGRRELILISTCVIAAAYLSMEISRSCLNVDRRWHVPLVTSIRGQTLPFHNVYDPHGLLAYHYTGDVVAAQLQALSFGCLHSSFALSLAHDVVFGLTAATIALLMRHGGMRRTPFIVLAVLGVLLAGPITLLRPDGEAAGYDYIDYLRLSYRPYVSLSGLFVSGFYGALWVRLREPTRVMPAVSTWPVLVALTAALALTDEPSLAFLGIATFAAWVVDPNVLAPRRVGGVGILAALLVALVLSTLLFHGSLAPGAPHEAVKLVDWRAPGYHHGALPLDTSRGRQMLTHDLLAIGAIGFVGVLVVASSLRRRDFALLVCFAVVASMSVVALTRIMVGGEPEESHRFMTAVMLACPLFGLFFVLRARAPRVERYMGAIVPCVAVTAIGLASASTLRWLRSEGIGASCDKPESLFARVDVNELDCRELLGTRVGESTVPKYLASRVAYLYAGCHPVFAASSKQPGQHWAVNTGAPIYGRGALVTLNYWLGPDMPLGAACSTRADYDPICAYARVRHQCHTMGVGVAECYLTAADRARLLGLGSSLAESW